jgi:tRNA A37 threonylcarbamoyladenosine modification protein TsaB|tara:strand:- start:675 stop:983 length:309 start_codon:yes stop_codon:yes gene_type:complete
MDRLYLGEYSYSGELLKNSELTSIPRSAFNPSKYDEETFFVGEGCKLVLDSIKKVSNQISFELPSASELLYIAREKHASKDTVISEKILPIYLTEESNWVKS